MHYVPSCSLWKPEEDIESTWTGVSAKDWNPVTSREKIVSALQDTGTGCSQVACDHSGKKVSKQQMGSYEI